MAKKFRVLMVSNLTIKDDQYDTLSDVDLKVIILSAFSQKREDELFKEEVSVLSIQSVEDSFYSSHTD